MCYSRVPAVHSINITEYIILFSYTGIMYGQDKNSRQDGSRGYDSVNSILTNLERTDLMQKFREHHVQDNTLRIMSNEEDIKKLLKELDIPLGIIFPFIKLWFSHNRGQDHYANNYIGHNERMDKRIYSNHSDARGNKRIQDHHTAGATAIESTEYTKAHPPVDHNVLQSNDRKTVAHKYTQTECSWSGDLLTTMQFPISPAAFDQSILNWPIAHTANPLDNPNAAMDLKIEPEGQLLYPPFINDAKFGFSSYQNFGPKDQNPVAQLSDTIFPRTSGSSVEIVDEHEDLAIERSLQEENDKDQRSYASALKDIKQDPWPSLRDDDLQSDPARSRSSSMNISSPSSPRISPQLTASPARKKEELKTRKISPHDINKAENIYKGKNARLDDIPLDGSVKQKTTDTGSVEFYYHNLPESQDPLNRKIRRDGWKPIDGKQLSGSRTLSFNALFVDEKGRMRHGVRVRGADKSEECFKHTNSKVPAGCTFAHSRVGDTLEIICIKCTVEKSLSEMCPEKSKHRKFHFQLGAYKTEDGIKWKSE